VQRLRVQRFDRRRAEQDTLRVIIGHQRRPPIAGRLLSSPDQLDANPADPITAK